MDPVLRVAIALSFVASSGGAQRVPETSKDHESFRQVFESACTSVRHATLRVRADGRLRALACVVSRDGLALTKASEIRGARAIECEFSDGLRVPAVRGPVDEECDLVLLDFRSEIDARTKLRALQFDKVEREVGSFLACVGTDRLPVAVGVVSLAPYVRRTRGSSRGSIVLPFTADRSGARVGELEESTTAYRAGLRRGDIIESVSGRAVSSPASFRRAVRRKRAGTRVVLEVRRGERTLNLRMKVSPSRDRSGPRDPQQGLWGELSRVRVGFPKILQHDAVLRPRDCGGPLVDLDGRVLGLNIARVGRVETHALPSALVKERLAKLMAELD